MTDTIDNKPKIGNLMERLNTVLDVAPTEVTTTDIAPAEKFDGEYEFAQEKMKELVDSGQRAIEHLTDVCVETSEPKAFQALAQLIKATGDVTANVMNAAKVKSEIAAAGTPKPEAGSTFVQNNTKQIVFSGSTKELADFIKSQKESENSK